MAKKNDTDLNNVENINVATASVKSIKTSPQKANLVLSLIRGQNAESAINCLQFSNRRISNEIKKVLKAAIANAENNHQLDIDKLFVYEAFAGKAMVMKRFRPRAKGRAAPILKSYSNLTIILSEKLQTKEAKDGTKG